jgi:hypothetical protein
MKKDICFNINYYLALLGKNNLDSFAALEMLFYGDKSK